MKTKAKIAIAASVALIGGAALGAAPASAHDRGGARFGQSSQAGSNHQHATLSATITGIPSSVTSSHVASHGAYFTAYVLEDTATSVPSTKPTTGGKRIGLKPTKNSAGAYTSVISGSTLAGVLGFRADADGITKLALYPSDGSSAALVTITTSADGTVSVKSSKSLTVAYSATVAAEAPAKGMGKGGHSRGMRGKHGH